MRFKHLVFSVVIAVVASGCATNPNKISAAYVSPARYKDWKCDEIDVERAHIEDRCNVLYAQLNKDAKGDAWQMGIGAVLFWPALLALEGGDGPEATEYAQLKGEYEALRKTSVSKRCDAEFQSDLKNLAKPKKE